MYPPLLIFSAIWLIMCACIYMYVYAFVCMYNSMIVCLHDAWCMYMFVNMCMYCMYVHYNNSLWWTLFAWSLRKCMSTQSNHVFCFCIKFYVCLSCVLIPWVVPPRGRDWEMSIRRQLNCSYNCLLFFMFTYKPTLMNIITQAKCCYTVETLIKDPPEKDNLSRKDSS